MLYGRDVECRLVDDLVEDARRGRSGSLVLRGEAGIGKTALVRHAAEQVGDGRVLEMRGVEAESAMPFAGLHALLYPVRDRLLSLSEPQREALSRALGLAAGAVPSRFLVAAAVVELLAAMAEERLLLCVVDDAQWVDPQSLGTLTFVQRRLRADPIAMIFALRSGPGGQMGQAARLLADLRHVTVGPLDDAAAERVLDERRELDRSARTAVKAFARGNPLALVELSGQARPDMPAGPPPLTERLQADYLSRLDGLGNQVRRLLLLAAADDTGNLPVLLAAGQTHGDAEVQLAAAEERGLLQIAANTVEFSHPLVRSAVYQSATSTARREIHRALADALDGIDQTRATWHRAYAAVPPAEDVAAELADLGTAAARRAATDLAARAFSRAADLTANPRRRLAWLLDAAEASWESGHVERAVELVAIAREATCADTDVGRIDQLRGQLEAGTGSALQGYEILIEGATKILSVAPDRAGSMLFDALRAASVAGDMDRVVRAGQTAARLMIMDFPPPSACFAAAIAELLTSGGAGAVALLESGIEASQDSDHPEMLCVVATAAAFTGDHARTRQLATRAVSRCRETGALGTLARALEPLVVTQLDAAPRQAEASADEGLRAARETEQIPSTAIHLAGLATVAALRGDASSTEDLTEQVLLLDKTHGLGYPASMAVAARGLLALGLGRPDEALAHYESLVMGGGHRAVQLAAADFAMLAAVWSGRREQAQQLLETMGSWQWLQEANADWAQSTLDRWHALLSDGATATALFERSLARQVGSPRPFLRALTQLLLGEHLRRVRQRSAARPHLRRAVETFERLDAVPWADRAGTELRATGETIHRRDRDIARLTPQELQVAQLVATGASTKKVAAQLYLSPRTVDSHLRQIFTKMGISSRAEIRDIDLTG